MRMIIRPGPPTSLSWSQPRAAASGDRYDRGYQDALAEAQAYIAKMRAERESWAVGILEMKQLEGEALAERGKAVLASIPKHEMHTRLEAATILFGGLVEDPRYARVASLAMAVLGDESQLPVTEGMSIVQQSREHTLPEMCASAVDLAAEALGKELEDSQLVELGQRMVGAVDESERHPAQPGFASIRVLANLVARFDPQQECESTQHAVDFLTRRHGNFNFWDETEGTEQVIQMFTRRALHDLRAALELREQFRPAGPAVAESSSHVRVGGVVLRKRKV